LENISKITPTNPIVAIKIEKHNKIGRNTINNDANIARKTIKKIPVRIIFIYLKDFFYS
jgi:hypothetical protein